MHAFCGIWGTWSLGLFASGEFGATGSIAADNLAPLTGFFYGGGLTLLKAQVIGNGIIAIATFSVALALMYAVKATSTLRVSREGELEGLDIHEHGVSVYPEYMMVEEKKFEENRPKLVAVNQ